MDARFCLNRIKEETGIKTDKELAAAMGVKYGTLSKWIARNSIPRDPLIEFVVEQGIDYKQIVYDGIAESVKRQFSEPVVPHISKATIESVFDKNAQILAEQVEKTYAFISQYGNMQLLKKFEEELTSISTSYIEKCEKLKDMIEN